MVLKIPNYISWFICTSVSDYMCCIMYDSVTALYRGKENAIMGI